MKIKFEISHEYNSAFVPVGRQITKGEEPPPWLLIGLTHFANDIGNFVSSEEAKQFNTAVEQMVQATNTLLRWLPAFRGMGLGIQCPNDVAVVLEALPRIKADLDRLATQRIGHPPDVRRKICAAVVVEAWKLLHGKAQPRSEKTEEACNQYWLACGNDDIGDRENWRRDIKYAIDGDHGWIKSIFQAVQNPT